jgi:hypothetical protein
VGRRQAAGKKSYLSCFKSKASLLNKLFLIKINRNKWCTIGQLILSFQQQEYTLLSVASVSVRQQQYTLLSMASVEVLLSSNNSFPATNTPVSGSCYVCPL